MSSDPTAAALSPAKIWLLAARPKTLPAGAVPVFIGGAMAFEASGFHAPSFACALLGALLIQVGTNFANDYFDFVKGTDTEERIGPMRATQAGLVTPMQMRRATVLVFALAFLAGLYLVYRGGWPILAVGLLSILCGVLYTGGPYPLGYLGLGDLFVLVFFGPVAVAGTYYVQAQQLTLAPIIAGLGPGLLSTAILTVNNLRDADTDVKTGKRTLAVRFGKGFARAEYVACILLAAVGVPLLLVGQSGGHFAVLACALVLIPAVPHLRRVLASEGGPALNETLAGTGKLVVIHGVLFSIGWCL